MKLVRWSWMVVVGLGFPAFGAAQGAARPAGEIPSEEKPGVVLSMRTKDALVFQNGDLLYGRLVGIDRPGQIRWKHPDVAEPIQFEPSQVAEIHLRPGEKPEHEEASPAKLHLVNGDQLEGDLLRMTETNLVLDTWYAGRLEIPREQAKFVIPIPRSKRTVFEGVEGLEGWTMGEVDETEASGVWHYKGGALYAREAASVARDLKLPDVARVEFDLDWKGMLHLAFALYTDYLQPVNLAAKDTEPDFGGFYSLQLNNFAVNVLPVKQYSPLRYLGQATVPAFSKKNRAHVDVRINKRRNSIALLVDGELIKEWVDAEGFAGEGSGVRLVHQGRGLVRLSNLVVTEWDGILEEDTLPDRVQVDSARLRNGDRVEGQMVRLLEGRLVMLVSGNELAIPWERVKHVALAPGEDVAEAPRGLWTRAYMVDGGKLTFSLESFDGEHFSGTSPALGKVSLKPAAFKILKVTVE